LFRENKAAFESLGGGAVERFDGLEAIKAGIKAGKPKLCAKDLT